MKFRRGIFPYEAVCSGGQLDDLPDGCVRPMNLNGSTMNVLSREKSYGAMLRRGRGWCLLLALLMLSGVARGTEFLVTSVADLSVTLLFARPGDTLIMRDGVWQNADILFKANGTAANPITLRAQTPGQVILSGTSRLRLAGSYLVVDGLQFVNGFVTSDEVISFRESTISVANNCRLTECAIIDYNPADPSLETLWVSLYGTSNRVDHCYFKGKNNGGTTFVVWVDSQPDHPNYHRIDHNHFGPRPPLGRNGGETIRIGTSDVSLNLSRALVEYNFFEQCDGDVEVVSGKSGENTYRGNTFFECEGALTLRHGNGSVVEGNYFFGNGKPLTGGVRVCGEDHKIYDNYFVDLTGSASHASLALMQGLINSPQNGYLQVKRATVAFNTFVNCDDSILIGLEATLTGTSETTTLPPLDCTIANNVVYTTNKLVDQRLEPVNMFWQGNIMYGATLRIPPNSGITMVDPLLELAPDGLWRPATNSPALGAAQGNYDYVTVDMEGQFRPAAKDVGCDQLSAAAITNPPLAAVDVGPLWLRTAGTLVNWYDPNDITYGTALSDAQLKAKANVAGAFVYTPPVGTTLNAGNGQTLSVVFTPQDTNQYSVVTQTVTINVLKAMPAITWANPAAITYGTQLGAAQLNATANVPGVFGYNPLPGTLLNAGNGQTLTATFTPADSGNYVIATKSVAINVSPALPVITWAPPADITNGIALSVEQLNATANVPGTFVYTPPAGTVLSAGSGQILSVTFTPADSVNYLAAMQSVTINVTSGGKVVPIITWAKPAAIMSGTPLSDLQLNATANVPGSFAYTPPVGTVLPVGNNQLLTVIFTPNDLEHYTVATNIVAIDVAAGFNAALVRVAYLIPTNRVAQSNAVASLQNAIQLYRDWFREQMERNGFGPKTFGFETEADGVTPLIHTVHLPQTDSYLRGDITGQRVVDAVQAAGLSVGASGEVWWMVPETHVENSDGFISGKLDAADNYGDSSRNAGWAMMGSDSLIRCLPAYLTNNVIYNNLVLPELGPYPLKQDVSFSWYEGTSLSSISSAALGGGMQHLAEAFGLIHDYRNDENFNGNLMGHGFRGIRGALFSRLYPFNYTRLSYGAALALNVHPFFNPGTLVTDDTKPNVTVITAGTNAPVRGVVQITFTAADVGGLSAALLSWNENFEWTLVDEMVLTGTNVTRTFSTPFYNPAQANDYTVTVLDRQGNQRSVSTTIQLTPVVNHAPWPIIKITPATPALGEEVVFDASGTTDPEHSSSLIEVEWDLNGDGYFDTPPVQSLFYTNRYQTLGSRLVRARVADPAGAEAVSAPVAVKVTLCPVELSPQDRVHGYGATSGSVEVTGGNCNWTASSTNSWITILSGATGTGSGQVAYAVADNPTTSPRAGAVFIGDQTCSRLPNWAWPAPTRCRRPIAFMATALRPARSIFTPKILVSWTVDNTNNWITITSATSGVGNTTIGYSVTDNQSARMRTGNLVVADQVFAMSQWGTNCSVAIAPSAQLLPDAGGAGQVSVLANTKCDWTILNTNAWITLTSAATGTGNGTVTFQVAPNASATARTGLLDIGGELFTLTQSPCAYALAPTNRVHGYMQETGEVAVTTIGGCDWSVVNPSSWITILAGATGPGPGTVSYVVAANPTVTSRSAELTIAGQPFTVTQAGIPCTYTLSPTGWIHGESWEAGEFQVTAGPACQWSVINTNPWINILSGATGLSNGSVVYTVDANTNAARSGALEIAGQTYLVSQDNGLHLVQVPDTVIPSGETVCVPVTLEAHGNENVLRFSVCFDPALLAFASAQPGAGAPGASLSVSNNPAVPGQVGFMLAMPAGRVIPAGMQPVVEVCFLGLQASGPVPTPLVLCDQPVGRELLDLIAQPLAGQYWDATVTVIGECALWDAVDAPQSAWTTSGSAAWTCQTNVTHDFVDAAGSGAVADGQDSRLQTTVVGPGTVSFWWKVSSEPDNDTLRFYADGSELVRISGEVNWEWRSFDVGSGNQTLEWRYTKNSSLAYGQDHGWVDRVQFEPWAPTITQEPASQSVDAGATVSFSVAASGTPPFGYRWQFNGADLADGGSVSGSQTTTLRLSNVQLGQGGVYSVTVSNAMGSVSSQNALLTVSPVLPLAQALDTANINWTTTGSASWTGQAAVAHDGVDAARSGAVTGGQSTYLEATISGPGTLSFWWKVSSEPSNDRLRFYVDGSSILTISGEVDWQLVTYNLNSGSHDLQWRYYKNGSTDGGQDRGWVDQVQFAAVAPAITSQPASQSVNEGSTVTFSVAATGTPPLTYQWQLNGAALTDGGNVSGAKTATLRLTSVPAAQAGTYTVVVDGLGGGLASSGAVLVVTPVVPLDQALDTTNLTWTTTGTPVWVGQPTVAHDGMDAAQSGAITDGQNNAIRTTVTGPGRVGFWWKVSSEPSNDQLRFYLGGSEQLRISGEVDWEWQLFDVPSGSQTLEWRYVKNGSQSAGQDRAWVDQVFYLPTDATTAPMIANPPANQRVVVGSTATFRVGAAGSTPLSYQWQFHGTNLVDGGNLSGATSDILTLSNVQEAEAGAYSVVVTNAVGTAISPNASLSLITAPVITKQPDSFSVVAGDTVTFTVGALGQAPLQYQWQYDGTNLVNGGRISGATSSALTITGVQSAQAGIYSVRVSNDAGSASSEDVEGAVARPDSARSGLITDGQNTRLETWVEGPAQSASGGRFPRNRRTTNCASTWATTKWLALAGKPIGNGNRIRCRPASSCSSGVIRRTTPAPGGRTPGGWIRWNISPTAVRPCPSSPVRH